MKLVRPGVSRLEAHLRTVSFQAVGLLGALFLGGCATDDPSPQDEPLASEPADEPPFVPLTENQVRPVTDPHIAIGNLDAQIAGMERQLALDGSEQNRERFFELLSLRLQFLGKFSDFQTVEELARDAQGADPGSSKSPLWARFLLMVHEFEMAEGELERLDALGVDVKNARRTLELALFRDPGSWVDDAESGVQQRPTYSSHSELATIYATLGRFEEADEQFDAAERAYSDVSPFPLAWLAFQRGLMWSETAGRQDLGEFYYRRALRYLPDYVVANVHLAELLVSQDNRHEAEVLLLRASAFEDPEPQGKLATFYSETDQDESASYLERGTMRYDALLSQYPLAFSDHGSEFFRGPGGDPERALDLALDNLENRETPRSFLIAIAAAAEAGSEELLCELAARAQPFAPVSPVLATTLETEAPCDSN